MTGSQTAQSQQNSAALAAAYGINQHNAIAGQQTNGQTSSNQNNNVNTIIATNAHPGHPQPMMFPFLQNLNEEVSFILNFFNDNFFKESNFNFNLMNC